MVKKAISPRYDRAAEDVGNIVSLEHVNVLVPDQQLATAFYVNTLGFTRDPYMMTGLDVMWVNIGRSQLHLPTGEPNVLRGHTGLVAEHYELLPQRLKAARDVLNLRVFAKTAGRVRLSVSRALSRNRTSSISMIPPMTAPSVRIWERKRLCRRLL